MADMKQPYGRIIAQHLENRGSRVGDFFTCTAYGPATDRYVLRMCADLALEATIISNSPVSLEAVLKVERCACGHSDYHQKLALYMDELARGVDPFATVDLATEKVDG